MVCQIHLAGPLVKVNPAEYLLWFWNPLVFQFDDIRILIKHSSLLSAFHYQLEAQLIVPVSLLVLVMLPVVLHLY